MQLSTGPAIASSLRPTTRPHAYGTSQTVPRLAVLKGHEGPLERADFSPDGSRVITAARDGTARIWDAVSGEQHVVLQPVGNFPTAVFDAKGDRVLTAGDNSLLRSGMPGPE